MMRKGRGPIFYVALAHTDNLAFFTEDGEPHTNRMSNTRIFPPSIRDNLLFSMSYNSAIHYRCHAGVGDSRCKAVLESARLRWSEPRRLFADCGAFQYRLMDVPANSSGEEITAASMWSHYESSHLGSEAFNWDEILLCSPDHIITSDMDDRVAETRLEFSRRHASDFLNLSNSNPRVTPVAVIHGRTIEERKMQYEEFVRMGYDYVALGGVVPLSGKRNLVLEIIAGIVDPEKPLIQEDSILARCRRDGVRIHIFGLNSPDWIRWWYRLGIDSFDGSKLSTEGAANGWYWCPKDGQGEGREYPSNPSNASELYHKIAVDKIGSRDWVWSGEELLTPSVPLTDSGIDTTCNCPACEYLYNARCTSPRCWKWKEDDEPVRHNCDPRMMGSTEHNMGRVAHNAHVMDWILQQIETLVDRANREQDDWLRNWKVVEMER
jgi:hypothetical protein